MNGVELLVNKYGELDIEISTHHFYLLYNLLQEAFIEKGVIYAPLIFRQKDLQELKEKGLIEFERINRKVFVKLGTILRNEVLLPKPKITKAEARKNFDKKQRSLRVEQFLDKLNDDIRFRIKLVVKRAKRDLTLGNFSNYFNAHKVIFLEYEGIKRFNVKDSGVIRNLIAEIERFELLELVTYYFENIDKFTVKCKDITIYCFAKQINIIKLAKEKEQDKNFI